MGLISNLLKLRNTKNKADYQASDSYGAEITRCLIEIKLTKNESRLIEVFLANKNKYIKNEDIKRIIWSQKEISDSAFKSLINRLSNKIGKDLISNSFGMGYGIFD